MAANECGIQEHIVGMLSKRAMALVQCHHDQTKNSHENKDTWNQNQHQQHDMDICALHDRILVRPDIVGEESAVPEVKGTKAGGTQKRFRSAVSSVSYKGLLTA